jgi:hypothetical protein
MASNYLITSRRDSRWAGSIRNRSPAIPAVAELTSCSRHQFVIKQSGTLGNYAHVNYLAPD